MKSVKSLLLNFTVILMTAAMLAACSAGSDTSTGTGGTSTATTQETRVFTLDELAQYDGKEGRSAYIAVDGIVYDVSKIAQWAGGLHADTFQAGKDYSAEIRSESPHGLSMLSRAEKIGILAE